MHGMQECGRLKTFFFSIRYISKLQRRFLFFFFFYFVQPYIIIILLFFFADATSSRVQIWMHHKFFGDLKNRKIQLLPFWVEKRAEKRLAFFPFCRTRVFVVIKKKKKKLGRFATNARAWDVIVAQFEFFSLNGIFFVKCTKKICGKKSV